MLSTGLVRSGPVHQCTEVNFEFETHPVFREGMTGQQGRQDNMPAVAQKCRGMGWKEAHQVEGSQRAPAAEHEGSPAEGVAHLLERLEAMCQRPSSIGLG